MPRTRFSGWRWERWSVTSSRATLTPKRRSQSARRCSARRSADARLRAGLAGVVGEAVAHALELVGYLGDRDPGHRRRRGDRPELDCCRGRDDVADIRDPWTGRAGPRREADKPES